MANYAQYPWGYQLLWADTKEYSAYMYVIQEGNQTPYVYHKNRDKTIFVLQGTVQLIEEGKSRMLNPGESYHIPPKLMHRIVAIKGDVTVLDAGTPVEEDDIVTVEA